MVKMIASPISAPKQHEVKMITADTSIEKIVEILKNAGVQISVK